MANLLIKEYLDLHQDYVKAGSAVYDTTFPLIDKGKQIIFDMKGIDGVSLVFLNASMGKLMDVYGMERVKKSFNFTNNQYA